MFQPLNGLTVVDLSQVLAGPYATYQLSLMGADVIKIEKPGEGDWTRSLGPREDLTGAKLGLGFMTQNAGKKSVTLNLKTPEGLELARKLVATADIFVENFKPGVAERLGLGFDAVRQINPTIVYCSISAYGQDGPLSARPAYDHIIQGMCGIMKTTGKVGDGPTKVGAPYIDYATGMNAAMAILAGLREAERTQAAVQVDVAMLDTALMLMASLMTQHLSSGWIPAPNGNEAWSASPSSGAFETAEGTLMLAANNDPQFAKLCHAIGRADILADPRWKSLEERAENGVALREELNRVFLEASAAEWEERLAGHDVPAARIRGLDEVLAEDQVRARGLIHQFTHYGGAGSEVHVPTMSFKANGKNVAPRTPPASLGSDTDDVLGAVGITPDQLAKLRDAGVI